MKKNGILIFILGIIGFIFLILLIGVSAVFFNFRNEYKKTTLSKEEKEKKPSEYMNLISKILEEDFNMSINQNLYKIEEVYIPGGYFFETPESYIMKKYNNLYKSKYFYTNDEEGENVLVVEHMNDKYLKDRSNYKRQRFSLFLDIVDRLGFREYVLNNLLYDKSKGNDFTEIEKIFNNYKKGEVYRDTEGYNYYDYNGSYKNLKIFYGNKEDMKYDRFSGFLVYKEAISEKEVLDDYVQHFIDYFKEERKLEEMDWYDFKEYNKLRPVIIFRFENSEKKGFRKNKRWNKKIL